MLTPLRKHGKVRLAATKAVSILIQYIGDGVNLHQVIETFTLIPAPALDN